MEGCPLRLFLFPASCVIVGAARWQVLTASVWVLDSRLLVQGWAAIFFYCLGIASRIMRAASCGSFAVASTSLVRVSSKMQVLSGSCYQFPFVYSCLNEKYSGPQHCCGPEYSFSKLTASAVKTSFYGSTTLILPTGQMSAASRMAAMCWEKSAPILTFTLYTSVSNSNTSGQAPTQAPQSNTVFPKINTHTKSFFLYHQYVS